MPLPGFLLRKLYKRGSLRQVSPGSIAFTLHNPLGPATLLSPPRIVVNGVQYLPHEVTAADVELGAISQDNPLPFGKGSAVDIAVAGHLLRGGNRLHITALTREWGELDIVVDERIAGGSEEE